MNKLVLISIFICLTSYSQITVTKHDFTPIIDGDVVAFSSSVFPASELAFYVKNNSINSTNVRISCVSLLNTDGAGFELCFGNECLASVEEGTSYPSSPVTLAPNASNGNFDHFLNTIPGTGTKDFVFKFYQLSGSNAIFGNSITFTYRYSPNLSVDEVSQLENSGVILKSALIENELELDVLKPTSIEIYNINGKMVFNTALNYGVQSIDVSNLKSSIYVLKFKNSEGKTSTKKFIKK
jgi:Secretion system C-terminal sorting domain